ncbi:MAG: preprotein translocase subunit SecA [Holosporales bacterium]|jgi:preprotein translocase subunit SecA|nr:preprotein translocase subunit SecA [Holosporales bacterium]
MLSFLNSAFTSSNTKVLKAYNKLVKKVNEFEDAFSKLSDADLSNKTVEFKNALSSGKTLDDILPEAFAVVREASKRVLGLRHFDVQLLGGIALHKGQIAEMKTGEGKTLVATSPVYLNALAGKGVHVVTVNDYLARRDAAWMGKIYEFLGLTVSVIVSGMSDEEKKMAYGADISYGTNHEFGFDYLRDNLKFLESEMVLRPFNFAVIDEVDSILIDEARTPLIISGSDEGASQLYVAVDAVVRDVEDEDFEKDEKSRVVTLTDSGIEKIEQGLVKLNLLPPGTGLYDLSNISIVYHVNCALKAHKIFSRNVDYMVRNGQVVIIDEFTGRVMEGRRYSEGLHQALEAKEGVKVQTESMTVATISYQNLFRMYPKLSGMTGTAMTEEAEFEEIYNLKVVSIPPHRPVIRKDYDDSIYLSMEEKDRAVIALIKESFERKQPVLVGTTSLERSEYISQLLMAEGIKHNVLNAKQHEREAYVVAEAGAPGAVTIATNMAGRGTDIKLGGSLEMRVEQECASIIDPLEREKRIQEIKEEIDRDHKLVVEVGGLFVIGTERNENRRIDNQLRGRSGRQGDPGASKYFLSLEDDLIRKFGSPNFAKTLQKMGVQKDEDLTHRWISKAIEKAQQRVEAYNFDVRKQLLRYDDVMNDQRKIAYEQRRILMNTDDVVEYITDMIYNVVDDLVLTNSSPDLGPSEWNWDHLLESMRLIFNIDISHDEIASNEQLTQEGLRQKLEELAIEAYEEKRKGYNSLIMRYYEKDAALRILDQGWRNHLVILEHLRRGINLRSYAQKNPLNEYKFEAFNIFQDMLKKVQVDVLTRIFSFTAVDPQDRVSQFTDSFDFDQNDDQFDDDEYLPTNEVVNEPIVSRNALCYCGSGKRFKHCHGTLPSVKFATQDTISGQAEETGNGEEEQVQKKADEE